MPVESGAWACYGSRMEAGSSAVLVRLPEIAGVDLSVTHEVLLLWLAGGVTFALLALAARRRGPVARGLFRNLFELLFEKVEEAAVLDNMGTGGRVWTPLLLSLFFFIQFANLLGMVPLPGLVQSATANLSVTAALALLVFALTVGVSVRRRGVRGFLASFVPPGLPWPVRVLVVPIEIASWLAKPVSLAIRLFANIVAGHSLLFVFIGLEVTTVWFLKPLPLAGAVVMECFELFVMLIQAFVFTLLAGIYIKEAQAEAH